MRAGRMRLRSLVSALLIAAGWIGSAQAQPARAPVSCTPAPLLQEGKTQILERVLTRPGAALAKTPGAPDGKPVPGFSVLFVYDRSPDGKALQVGARSDCRPEGWVAADMLVPWKHTMVAAFANRTGRDRVLFFDRQESLQQLIADKDAGAAAAKLREAAAPGAPGSGPVVAVEPEAAVDMTKQFYLLPILDASTGRFASRKAVRSLRVAAVTQQDKAAAPAAAAAAPAPPPQAAPPADVRRNFRAAVVFVIDASASMQPYIDRTRDAVDRVYRRIEQANMQDRVRFGLIGYRDDPKAVPGVEYLTRVFVDPNTSDSRESFNKLSAGLTASTVSTRAFAEDGYAGIDASLRDIKWDDFAARFVVLITDASSRDPDSGLSTTGMTAERLRVIAHEKQVPIFVLHLLTPAGAKDHATGRRQYQSLAQVPGRNPLYYPVPAGDVDEFGRRVDSLATALTQLVQAVEEGQDPLGSRSGTPEQSKNPDVAMAEDIAAIGHAMQLAYIGKVTGTKAPSMFEAWAADRDFEQQAVATFDIRVLLTKTQLSDLESTVKALSEAYKNSKIDPSTLVQQLRSAAATLSRDPTRIGTDDHRELSKAILGEYLAGLPYTSRVMNLDPQKWNEMSPGQQQEIIDDLDVMSRLYRRFHDDVSLWISLAEGASATDAVYPVPITALP